jgi:group I intron endonuclease
MEEYVIYKLTSPNEKVYIGQTNNFNGRMAEHKSNSKWRKTKLYNCIRKYGWDMFTKEIIGNTNTKQNANILEESLIQKYKATGHNGLNTRITAEGGDVWEGRYDTQEYQDFVAKMKEINAGEKNGMYGKTHRQSTMDTMKERAKGRFTLEWYKERNGDVDGERLYEERRVWLKNRNLKKDENGRFIKSSKS